MAHWFPEQPVDQPPAEPLAVDKPATETTVDKAADKKSERSRQTSIRMQAYWAERRAVEQANAKSAARAVDQSPRKP